MMPWVNCPSCGTQLTLVSPISKGTVCGTGLSPAYTGESSYLVCEAKFSGTWDEIAPLAKRCNRANQIEIAMTGRLIERNPVTPMGKIVFEDELSFKCGWRGLLSSLVTSEGYVEARVEAQDGTIILRSNSTQQYGIVDSA
jgi:hypothetical protein